MSKAAPGRSFCAASLPLRCEIFLAFAVVLIAVAGLIGGAAWSAIERLSHSTITRDIRYSAESVAQLIEQSLLDRRHEMELIASSTELQAADADPAAAKTFLRRVQEISPRYALLGFVTRDGVMAVTSNGLAEGADVASRDYYLNGRSSIYVGDAHDAILLATALGGADRVPRFIDLAAPVRSGDRLVGVVVAHLSTEWAQDVGRVVLDGLVAHYGSLDLDIHAADGRPIFSHTALKAEDRAVLTAMSLIGGIGTNGRLSWPVRIRIPEKALATHNDSAWFVLVAIAGICLLALAGAWLLAGLIATPIARLRTDVIRGEARTPPDASLWTCREVEDMRAAMHLDAKNRNTHHFNY